MSDFIFHLNSKGYLVNRESFDLEYKQSFQFGDSLFEYGRSMVGMANNRGGKIIFGIKDSPREPVGLQNDKFNNCDTNKFNQALSEYFSHDFEWELSTTEFEKKEFGVIEIQESNYKPIICKKFKYNILREGAIYYRYRGETKEISFPELDHILNSEKMKERKMWIQHIKKISDIGPQNIQLIDTYKGIIETGNKKILLDRNLLDKIKFVKEGEFVEKEGAPALVLKGEITGLIDTENSLSPDQLYPLRATEIQKNLGINSYGFKLLIVKYKIKENPRYHTSIKVGVKSYTHKYTQSLQDKFSAILTRYPDTLQKIKSEYH